MAKPTLEVMRRLFVGAVQVATLHPTCHQGSVRIFDDQVGFTFRVALDHPNVVYFQALAGMNAANLLDGVLSDDP